MITSVLLWVCVASAVDIFGFLWVFVMCCNTRFTYTIPAFAYVNEVSIHLPASTDSITKLHRDQA